ncbi:LppA family lipoprotein [Sciscionella marina]|uniref:LppA family lipoprotein n=1 Tax=Sciscionella marina TaxID=508770 RepID=UPI0012F6E646|nr:LppA family lipoprotein [Sciscionella marina]
MKNTIATFTLAASLLTIVGCGAVTDDPPSNGVDMQHPDEAFAKLAKLPSIDEAVQQYEQLGSQIRQELSQEIPDLTAWKDSQDSVGGSGCFNEEDGEKRHLPDYVVQKGVTDQQYEQALQIIGKMAKPIGFGDKPQRFHDSPGKHDSSFFNPRDNTTISFGTGKATVLQISVGCHLTPEAKKRGHPSES